MSAKPHLTQGLHSGHSQPASGCNNEVPDTSDCSRSVREGILQAYFAKETSEISRLTGLATDACPLAVLGPHGGLPML